jgi:hypothetical protein
MGKSKTSNKAIRVNNRLRWRGMLMIKGRLVAIKALSIQNGMKFYEKVNGFF